MARKGPTLKLAAPGYKGASEYCLLYSTRGAGRVVWTWPVATFGDQACIDSLKAKINEIRGR